MFADEMKLPVMKHFAACLSVANRLSFSQIPVNYQTVMNLLTRTDTPRPQEIYLPRFCAMVVQAYKVNENFF